MADRTARPMPKKATNVSVRTDLLEAARAFGLNLSATLERALMNDLKEMKRQKWRDENREAIESYNELVEKHGVFSDGSRSF